MNNLSDEIETVLFIGREVSVYKIPPLKANEGHRANDWGDLANPLWKGRLRIIEKSSGVALYFEDSTTGELFAKADYNPLKPSLEAVLDSSRYFVVRIEDSGKKAYIGMGFAERSDSFDFNVVLQDYTKQYKASLNPPSPTTGDLAAGPKKDYSLKEGQTISISIPGRRKTPTASPNLLGSVADGSSSGGSFPLLPPPPSAPKRRA